MSEIPEAQVINKILETHDFKIALDNGLTENDFFIFKNEYKYLQEFWQQYHSIPDKVTFIDKFSNFKIFKVDTSDSAIIDNLHENILFQKAVEIINKSSTIFQEDANKGAEYLLSQIDNLRPSYTFNSQDIIHSQDRYDEYMDKKDNFNKYFISTGFKEFDDAGFMGFNRKEDFVLIMARTSTGKTQMSIKMAQNIWQQGLNVSFFSPEMSPNLIGYRFDSSNLHFSNYNLMYGNPVKGYKEYMEKLSESKNSFKVSTMETFGKEVTVPKLRQLVLADKSDILFIDGFDYLTDVRAKKYNSREDRLGNIAKDLLNLSIELSIPVISVIQANRKSTEGDKTLSTENITGADKIGASCTRLITLQTNGPSLQLKVPKNRYGRNDINVLYQWDKDTSEFFFIPKLEDIDEKKEIKKDKLLEVF